MVLRPFQALARLFPSFESLLRFALTAMFDFRTFSEGNCCMGLGWQESGPVCMNQWKSVVHEFLSRQLRQSHMRTAKNHSRSMSFDCAVLQSIN